MKSETILLTGQSDKSGDRSAAVTLPGTAEKKIAPAQQKLPIGM
ncbi:MAG: hypothetical protein PVH71_08620 [Chromatiales bacterium]|jgi:hypothetical protein